MSTEEKMIKAVELKGAKENLDRFAFTIPDYLQNEWAYADDCGINYEIIYEEKEGE